MKFSVIIPVWNNEEWLDKCFKSILNQTYKDYEVGKRTVPLQILQDLAKFYKVSTNYFFENMPQLPPDKELIMHRFAESVANNKEKYITIDLFDPNAMKKILWW